MNKDEIQGTCYTEETFRIYLEELRNAPDVDESDMPIHTIAPNEYLYQEEAGESAIICLPVILLALHLKEYQAVEMLCKKGFWISPWEPGKIILSENEIPYSMGQILVLRAKEIPKTTLQALYQAAFLNNMADAAYMDFERDLINNPFLGITEKGLEDSRNLSAYEKALENLAGIHEKCPLLLRGMCSDEIAVISYYDLPLAMRGFYQKLKRTLLECFASSEFDRKNVLACFRFQKLQAPIQEVMGTDKEKEYLALFAEWRDSFLDEYLYFSEDIRTKGFYFFECISEIAPLVGVYHTQGIFSEKTMKSAYIAVEPIIQKMHDLYDSNDKLYDLWESMYYTENINCLEKEMLWIFKVVMGFQIELEVVDDRVFHLLENLFLKSHSLVIESIELIDGVVIDEKNIESYYKLILKAILQHKNVELLQLLLEKEMIPKDCIEKIIEDYRKLASLQEQCNLLPCMLAFRAAKCNGK